MHKKDENRSENVYNIKQLIKKNEKTKTYIIDFRMSHLYSVKQNEHVELHDLVEDEYEMLKESFLCEWPPLIHCKLSRGAEPFVEGQLYLPLGYKDTGNGNEKLDAELLRQYEEMLKYVYGCYFIYLKNINNRQLAACLAFENKHVFSKRVSHSM